MRKRRRRRTIVHLIMMMMSLGVDDVFKSIWSAVERRYTSTSTPSQWTQVRKRNMKAVMYLVMMMMMVFRGWNWVWVSSSTGMHTHSYTFITPARVRKRRKILCISPCHGVVDDADDCSGGCYVTMWRCTWCCFRPWWQHCLVLLSGLLRHPLCLL